MTQEACKSGFNFVGFNFIRVHIVFFLNVYILPQLAEAVELFI